MKENQTWNKLNVSNRSVADSVFMILRRRRAGLCPRVALRFIVTRSLNIRPEIEGKENRETIRQPCVRGCGV